MIGGNSTFNSAGPASGWSAAKLAENLRKIIRNSNRTFSLVMETEIGHTKKSEFSGIKLLKKSDQKSGNTYVQIRN